MAVQEHLEILKSGKENWNNWMTGNWNEISTLEYRVREGIAKVVPKTRADLSGIDLKEFGNLSGFTFYKTDLSYSNISNLKFDGCNFRKANLCGSIFRDTQFLNSNFDKCMMLHTTGHNAHFTNCSLFGANLGSSNFYKAKFTNCNLTQSSIGWTQLIETEFHSSELSYTRAYGTSVWNCNFIDSHQKNIRINKEGEPLISVDDIEIAQFIHLMLTNKKIKNVISTLTSKVVLILGRFTEERLSVLREIKEILRERNYVPVLFDFEPSINRDITETVSTIAHLSKFIIADLTSAKSIPQELSHIIPNLPSVTIQPILLDGEREYGMFEHLERYNWVKEILFYSHDVVHRKEMIMQLVSQIESN